MADFRAFSWFSYGMAVKKIMKMLMTITITGLTALLTGCASYKIKQVSPDELKSWGAKNSKTGYVFFQPELYFLVTADVGTNNFETGISNGGATKKTSQVQFTVSPIYLPNYMRPYRVVTHNFLAKSDFTFNFADGWQLTSISDKSDNTTVANTIAGELQTVLTNTVRGESVRQLRNQILLLRPQYDNEGQITNVLLVPLLEAQP